MNKKPLISRGGPPAKVLWVEGTDDFHFIANLREQHNFSEASFTIECLDGIENVLSMLPTRLKANNETELGVMVDADTDVMARWNSLRNILIKAGYANVPPTPDPAGTVITETGRATVGIWIMPDNTVPGILEDFIHFLVPPNDKLWPLAEKAINGIPAADRLFFRCRFAQSAAAYVAGMAGGTGQAHRSGDYKPFASCRAAAGAGFNPVAALPFPF